MVVLWSCSFAQCQSVPLSLFHMGCHGSAASMFCSGLQEAWVQSELWGLQVTSPLWAFAFSTVKWWGKVLQCVFAEMHHPADPSPPSSIQLQVESSIPRPTTNHCCCHLSFSSSQSKSIFFCSLDLSTLLSASASSSLDLAVNPFYFFSLDIRMLNRYKRGYSEKAPSFTCLSPPNSSSQMPTLLPTPLAFQR